MEFRCWHGGSGESGDASVLGRFHRLVTSD